MLAIGTLGAVAGLGYFLDTVLNTSEIEEEPEMKQRTI